MKKVIKGLVKGTFSPLGLASIGIESDLLHNSVTDGTLKFQRARERQDLINKLPKETRKKLKSFKQFQEGAAAVLAAPAIANKVISTGAALWGMYNTINNQGPGIKDGSGTKKGGVWDSLPKGKRSNLKGIANEVRKKMNKDKLKKTIEDLYGPIPEHVNWMKEIIEDAPPGAKYERMVKHIKKSYKKDGKLTDEEKGIAYATAWKNYKNKTG